MLEYDDDNIVVKSENSDPVLTKVIQPWKDKNITHEDILKDLMGCILNFWSYYRNKFDASYSQEEAISDAYRGILKAINRDMMAPTCAGKRLRCEHCNEHFNAPDEMPGDERANKIYKDFPADRVPQKRTIAVNCPSCSQTNMIKLYKTKFSTCVYPYIRSEIQRGVVRACSKKGSISIDGFSSDSEGSLLNMLAVKEKEELASLPSSVMKIIDEILISLPERQGIVLALTHGIGGVYNDIIERDIICPHCESDYKAKPKRRTDRPQPLKILIDYSVSKNEFICPDCGQKFNVNMAMNQTDIAKHLNVSKQRVCSSLKSIFAKLRGEVSELDTDYHKWKSIANKLYSAVSEHGLT